MNEKNINEALDKIKCEHPTVFLKWIRYNTYIDVIDKHTGDMEIEWD